MDDPVILPGSKISIDRATIRSHLLSDPHDPFNRVPLKMEDVVAGKIKPPIAFRFNHPLPFVSITNLYPDTDLKAKIEAFKHEKLAGKRKEMVHQQTEQMDTS